MSTSRRLAAVDVVQHVLDRLTVTAFSTAGAPGAGAPVPDRSPDESLADLSLADGHPGISLAFSGTVPRRPGHAARAHDHLARATSILARGDEPAAGIYNGPGSMAYALLIAHRSTGGYRSALERLDDFQRNLVRTSLPEITDAPVASNGQFEVVRGLSGIGRYLLARGETCAPELRLLLGHLVELAHGRVMLRGRPVPRWWTAVPALPDLESALPDGHLNLGLSHGIAGPLALLSLAWRDGVVVEGHREAIEQLVGLFEEWTTEDGDGIRWPDYLGLTDWSAGYGRPTGRTKPPSWCYGAPGTSRAIQLAALALDRSDWHDLVHRSLLPLLTTPLDAWGTDTPWLCHGWGGLLHLFGLLKEHIDDPRPARVHEQLATAVLERFDTGTRFGFSSPHSNAPGFLTGAAGTALALDAYANGGRAHSGWDMALLVN
ncbi:lanthionine synthetase C family protein [Streptomyces sp. I05A-00742]|uniref:lanthionine synthetase C family protein n=1 Tax=Streptomyces sp. I05A-00742 TaxID=2732853 RepID=UPI001489E00B|nr:lanthionine synthetase C family protein [Streptomyces sp. I05A-00742]